MSNSTLISEREVSIGQYAGIECVLKAKDINMTSTKLFVLTKQKMIVADISGQPGKVAKGTTRAFLDSLRFPDSR